jgi:exonuclease SbcD
MRILAIGDPHFKVDTLYDSDQFIVKVESVIQANLPLDYIIILGDVLHTHEKIYTFALQKAVKFIKMCAEHALTIVLVGNHDATSNTIFCGDNHWMKILDEYENVIVADKPLLFGTKPFRFLCCPYVTDGRFVEALNTFPAIRGDSCEDEENEEYDDENEYSDEEEDGWKAVQVIFAHQLFNGAKMGAITATDVEDWHTKWPTIISGHIHDKQSPQPNLHYVGSSQQHAFGETEDKSLCLITSSNSTHIMKEINLDLKKKKIVYASIADLKKMKLSDTVTYKIVVEDDDANLKAFKKTAQYKQLLSNANVKAVQCKSSDIRDASKLSNNKDTACDFLSLLQARIDTEKDPYFKSYASHLLIGGEDVSCKDVVF